LSRKTRDLDAAYGKCFAILSCTVLTQYSSVTDRQTDAQAMAKTRELEHSAIARKKLNDSHMLWAVRHRDSFYHSKSEATAWILLDEQTT